MAAHRVHAQTDDLGVAFREFRLQARHVAEFGGAYGREIFGVREQHDPIVADPVVEVDFAFRRFGFEIRGDIANLERHGNLRTLV